MRPTPHKVHCCTLHSLNAALSVLQVRPPDGRRLHAAAHREAFRARPRDLPGARAFPVSHRIILYLTYCFYFSIHRTCTRRVLQALHALTSKHFAEKNLFRVDHYLAKEVKLPSPSTAFRHPPTPSVALHCPPSPSIAFYHLLCLWQVVLNIATLRWCNQVPQHQGLSSPGPQIQQGHKPAGLSIPPF